jgi:hypothetical protein
LIAAAPHHSCFVTQKLADRAGAEGAVYAAWFLESPVAVKKFERAADSLHEVGMYLQLGSHDNVVALRWVWLVLGGWRAKWQGAVALLAVVVMLTRVCGSACMDAGGWGLRANSEQEHMQKGWRRYETVGPALALLPPCEQGPVPARGQHVPGTGVLS